MCHACAASGVTGGVWFKAKFASGLVKFESRLLPCLAVQLAKGTCSSLPFLCLCNDNGDFTGTAGGEGCWNRQASTQTMQRQLVAIARHL